MYRINQKGHASPKWNGGPKAMPRCLLHPTSSMTWRESRFRWQYPRAKWTCDGCRAEWQAKRLAERHPPPVVAMQRTRAARLDPAVVDRLIHRLYGLAVPMAVATGDANGPTALAGEQLRALGIDAEGTMEEEAETAWQMILARPEQRYPRHRRELQRDTIEGIVARAWADVDANLRDLGAGWQRLRAELAEDATGWEGCGLHPGQLAAAELVYMAFAEDEMARRRGVTGARVAHPIARALLTKRVLILHPPERRRNRFYED